MNTTMTTGNIQAILALAEQKGLIPDRTTRIIASGILADAFDKDADLSNRDAWRAAFKLPPLNPPVFRFIDTVEIPATDRFEVDRIKIGEVDGVKVGYVNGFFTSCFGGLVEEAQAALTLRRNELTRTASCSAINEALGTGVEEATMSQVWALMKRQGKGQKKGSLHVDGKANLFRVRDAKGVLRLVHVRWDADYGDWDVVAYEVDLGVEWDAERLVFSRNS